MVSDLLSYLKQSLTDYEVLDDLWLPWVPIVLDKFEPTTNVVIMVVYDHLLYGNLCKPITDDSSSNGITPLLVSHGAESIRKLALRNPLVTFIVLQQNKFLEREIPIIDNLFICTNVEGIWIEYNERRLIEPIYEKDFNNIKHVLCLNNNPRPHRVGTVMYMLIRKLGTATKMSFLSNERIDGESNAEYDYETFLSWALWDDDVRGKFKEIYESQLTDYKFLAEYVYDTNATSGGNVINFNDKLSHHYKHTFIDVITESTCIETSLNLTEKYINSIFGCAFPILIATHGSVGFIRSLGFDVFDDVINHSYDNEPNHFYRMKKAIDLNYDLLIDSKRIKELWSSRIDRFERNVNHYNNVLHEKEFKRLTDEIDTIVSDIT